MIDHLPFVRALALAALLAAGGCDITETGFTCAQTCVVVCDTPLEAAFFSAEVLATGDDGRVRLLARLGGTAEVSLEPGDEIAHRSLWVELAPGDDAIVTIAPGASGEPEVQGSAFPLDGAGDNVLCSDSNPQDPDIPLSVEAYMALAGGEEECRADLEERGIPVECEDTP